MLLQIVYKSFVPNKEELKYFLFKLLQNVLIYFLCIFIFCFYSTVIDFCLTKNLVCDEDTSYQSLRLCWASKNSCDQRKGKGISLYKIPGLLETLALKAFYVWNLSYICEVKVFTSSAINVCVKTYMRALTAYDCYYYCAEASEAASANAQDLGSTQNHLPPFCLVCGKMVFSRNQPLLRKRLGPLV